MKSDLYSVCVKSINGHGDTCFHYSLFPGQLSALLDFYEVSFVGYRRGCVYAVKKRLTESYRPMFLKTSLSGLFIIIEGISSDQLLEGRRIYDENPDLNFFLDSYNEYFAHLKEFGGII